MHVCLKGLQLNLERLLSRRTALEEQALKAALIKLSHIGVHKVVCNMSNTLFNRHGEVACEDVRMQLLIEVSLYCKI